MWSSDEHHHTATCIQPDMANPGAKLGRAKLGSDWLPARPWTGGGVPMETVTIGVKGSAHPSKRAYLAIFASPVPYAFFGKVETVKGKPIMK